MYLTRFRVNTARSGARALLASPQRLHGAVDMAFPEPAARDGNGPRVLWRLDEAPANRVDLLISSPGRPDLTHLAEQAGWPILGAQGWTTFAYAEFLDRLAAGGEWAFRLTANPLHHIRRETDPVGAPTKRAAHVTVEHQVGWLLKHQERAGFHVLPRETGADDGGGQDTDTKALPVQWHYQLVVHDRTAVRFQRRGEHLAGQRGARSGAGTGTDVRFTRVTFDGRLRITDLAAFRRTLTHGMGKSKAYGCGLMTLAPVR
ncbi:type I-E CRISPR-associated protein Cas6/Cse3/CasE [Streptomyces sp. OfavH-34-F]|uniref:type I-E CRISPR-associated protein Cas6/Cse3/CasE n=1 Tax=Streptomyces sp. OfavH-34-F TaxID=2917760 RepID=UPI001EF29F60|nr:type I-E CRISPR-associated protein Cas6/Cse3/CasE [Streptomyces sp. OfavH-34-F]MCG7527764.1 type I-E CRISPR-associated protein Cas6/Cse3/CasE [Streptomyces sp. OfavH-34-F]